jgi:2-polyprenyl-3-methyl-5-hydroxy-6-metoxy-1,4-benzoquinol methylase
LRKLRRRLVNGYTNWRFSTEETPASSVGIFVLWAAWPFKIGLDQQYRHLPRLPGGGGAVLDFGCGGGSFLRIAQSCGWNVTGVDPDPKAVANCRSQGLNVLQGGVEQFDGKDGLFDVITMSHVIEHVHDPVGVMKVCHRLLKPGGRLWLETPNVDSLGHRHYTRNWIGFDPPRHLMLFNPTSMRKALIAAGFTHIEPQHGPTSLIGTTMASEAIIKGLPIGSRIKLRSKQKWMIVKNSLLQALDPSCGENLTVVGFKTEG